MNCFMILNLNHINYGSVLTHLRLLPFLEVIKECQGLGNFSVATMTLRPITFPQDFLVACIRVTKYGVNVA